MQPSAAMTRQRQIRGFVIAWLGITLLMGALTFAGIYYATGLTDNEGDDTNVAVLPNPQINAAAVAPLGDQFDLSQIETTPVPTADAAAVAVADVGEPDAQAEALASGDEAAPGQDVADGQGGGPAEQASVADTGGQSQPAGAQQATPVPTITPLPVDNTAFQVGIQVQPNPDASVYTLWMGEVSDKLKLGWIKQQVEWKFVEPQPGQYDWSLLDVPLDLAHERNIKVMLSVLAAPDWALEPGVQLVEDEEGPPADPQVFANFLVTLLYRYPGKIHAIEVWNEQNLDREWQSASGLSAQNYVNMLRASYTAIKSVDPGIIVISGALSPATTWADGSAIDDFTYMEQMIQAGMLDTADCVGAHHNGYNIGPGVPFNNVPNDPTAVFRGPFDNQHHSWSFYSTLQGYAQRIQQAGSDKKLCITEFGWASAEGLGGYPPGFEFATDNTLAEQAQFFDEAIQLMESWGFVWIAWVWNLNYGPQAGWDPSNDNVPYSLIRPNYLNSPAYDVIAQYDFRGR